MNTPSFNEDSIRRDTAGRFTAKAVAEVPGGVSALPSGHDGCTLKRFDDLFDRPEFDTNEYRDRCEQYLSGCTKNELTALTTYVQAGYTTINGALYGSQPLPEGVKTTVRRLDAALAKAPEAPEGLWRSLGGNEMAEQFLDQNHQAGDVIELHGFTSTSQTPDAMSGFLSDKDFYITEVDQDDWAKDPERPFLVKPTDEYTTGPARNVAFVMRTSTAAPVSTLRGSMVLEQEWLVPRGRKFRIAAVHRNVSLDGLHYGSDGIRAQVFELEDS